MYEITKLMACGKTILRHIGDKNFRKFIIPEVKHQSRVDDYGKSPYVIGDIKVTTPPNWDTLSIESYDLIYSDKYYSYENAGLLDNPTFLYNHFRWREGPYEVPNVTISKNDTVVDCGANIGLFSIMAKKLGAGHVIAYEPAEETCGVALENFKLNDVDVDLRKFGVFSEHKTLRFSTQKGSGSNCISNDGDSVIECVSLDDNIKEHVDFIKADIEGAERDMLLGATRILREDAPKLALCTYHLPDDKRVMTDIIKTANPKYKFKYSDFKMYGWVD